MAIETKMLIAVLTNSVGKAKSVREAYNILVMAANVEGMNFPSYEDFQKNLKEEEELAKNDNK